MNTLSKTAMAGLAALSLAAFAPSDLAVAAPFHGHGGGFHGGWHGGGFHGGGFHRGWHGGGWHGGGWHGGWGGGWAGPAIVGGLAAGALLAAPYAYGYNGCTYYQPMYDAYGNYIGQQLVNGCY